MKCGEKDYQEPVPMKKPEKPKMYADYLKKAGYSKAFLRQIRSRKYGLLTVKDLEKAKEAVAMK